MISLRVAKHMWCYLVLMCGLTAAAPLAAQVAYWNVFNEEGESAASAVIVTYETLADMSADTNRAGFGVPDSVGFGHNIVGSGSDGKTYWNVFNEEGESAASAVIVTYETLADMLADTNRAGFGVPDSVGFGHNVVGSGSDGKIYWNVFNEEGESAASAVIVTYETLADMLADTNRAGFGVPDSVGFGQNVVGSGSEVSRVEFQVSKDFTDDNSSEVTVSLECSSGLVSEPVQVSEGNPQTLSVLAFDSGEYGTTGCTVTESNMPEGYYQMSTSEGCEVADLTPGAQYDCEFVNAPNLASFKVSKDFSDNNAAEVEVTLTCNSGQPLEQSFMISEGKPVNFVVTDFQNGEMDCTVSETVAAEGYTPSYYNGSESSNTDCSYTDVVSGEHLCEISNAANPATYTVTKEWLIEGSGADGIDLTADVHVNCDSPILDVEGGTQALLKLVPVTLDAWVTLKGESDAATLTVDTTDGTARCSAVEDITQSGVESESDTGCSGASLRAGGSASCTITNTVFFEGIPTLNRWALGTLAVLMLGIGLTAFRRIV